MKQSESGAHIVYMGLIVSESWMKNCSKESSPILQLKDVRCNCQQSRCKIWTK